MSLTRTRATTFRRAASVVVVAAVGVSALTACGSSSDAAEDGGGLGTADKHVKITMMSNDAFAETWQEQLVPEFNKAYPYIDVTIDSTPYDSLLAKGMLNGTSPDPEYDLITLDDPWTPQLADAGVLLDLKDEAAATWTDDDYDWDDFNSAPLAASEWDGHQYGVPLRSNLLVMMYNKDLYSSAGVPEPTPELTWDEYMSQVPDLVQDTNGDGETDSWAAGLTWVRGVLSPPFWQAALNSNGGALFDDDMNPTFDTADGEAALQTQVDLLEYAPPGALTYNYNEPLDAFRQGKIATLFTWGSAFKSAAVDSSVTTLTPDQVGIQTMPAGSEGPSTHRGVWSGSVFKNSDNPEAAWTFLQWMSSKKGEKWASDNLGSFPARKSTLSSDPAEEWLKPVYTTIQSGFDVAADGEMWRPRSPQSNAIQEILANETSAAMQGKRSAADALARASAEIKELLED
ncbi:ABC transporter substrate-binding protein [Paramicrobacterium chengjingii]|uniref:Sugar ABC transporter substrate-binding protein n=1 Tax=Paramicrobacterium chengjingii TaxID=2769067 RepID=A0ABX6YL05_9MICO|nr:sugar ABC transporter substrate-binding protein [Microbacterium chengjingii]QPZ39355.1 sugar ABC transporter substrate-binding protein [Microbacterium chengjingii]